MKKLCIFFLALVCTSLLAQKKVEIQDPSVALGVRAKKAGFLMPRLTEKDMNEIQNPALGLMVYNLTKRCVAVYNGFHWICIAQGGGPWLSKDAYPIVAMISANGELQWSNVDMAVHHFGTGYYAVYFKHGEKLQVVTGNILSTDSTQDWAPMTGMSILSGPDNKRNSIANGSSFAYQTGDKEGALADRPVVLVALVKGDRLPKTVKRSYLIAGKINADGSSTSEEFSSARDSTGHYTLSFPDGEHVQGITMGIYAHHSHWLKDGLLVHTYEPGSSSSIQYNTFDSDGNAADKDVLFTAVVSYPVGSIPAVADGRHVISGAIHADGSIYWGSGFRTAPYSTGWRGVYFKKGEEILSVSVSLLGNQKLTNQVKVYIIDKSGFGYNTDNRTGDATKAIMFTAVVRDVP